MALVDVLPYFRNHLYTLGFTEWDDAFNFENLPSSILDLSYHLELGEISSTASNHQPHRFNFPIKLRVFLKGFNTPNDARSDAIERAEEILGELLPPSNRFDAPIYDVIPSGIAVEPLTASNDNSVILVIDFDVITFMKF